MPYASKMESGPPSQQSSLWHYNFVPRKNLSCPKKLQVQTSDESSQCAFQDLVNQSGPPMPEHFISFTFSCVDGGSKQLSDSLHFGVERIGPPSRTKSSFNAVCVVEDSGKSYSHHTHIVCRSSYVVLSCPDQVFELNHDVNKKIEADDDKRDRY